jgi:predicted Zn-dependent protease
MPYSTDYRRWRSGKCRIKVNGFDVPPVWQTVAQRAMQHWNKVGARFEFVVDPASPSSIVCDELGDNGWIGLTTLRPDTAEAYISQVLIRVNTRHSFLPSHPTTAPLQHSKQYDLYTVLLHELGHALHLGEDYGVNSTTVMCPTIEPGEVRRLTTDDISGIQLLYP